MQIKHNPFELMDFSIQPIMFVLLFTYVFGGAIAGSTHDYLMFALPGIIVQNALFTTLNTGVGLSTDLEKGFFDRLRSLPIARFAPLAGRIAADMVKQAWSVAMLLIVGVLLGFRVGNGPLGVIGAFAIVLVSALAVSWAIVLVSMIVASPEKVQIFGFVVLFPLTFTSNAFVPTGVDAGTAAGLGEGQPGHDHRGRAARAARLRAGRDAGAGVAAVGARASRSCSPRSRCERSSAGRSTRQA